MATEGLGLLRRIVTGHDASGRAVIVEDGPAMNRSERAHGTVSNLIWGTDQNPAEMWTGEDFGARTNVAQPQPHGAWFRAVEFPPHGPGRMHRTDTVDYAVVLQGKIDMEMDDGLTLTMNQGDVMVQQGTNHSWINNYDEPCRMAFVLIDGELPPGGSFAGPGEQKLAPLAPLPEGVAAPLPPVRRIVTTHDADGRAMVMMDGPAPNRRVGDRGNISTLIWATDGTPATLWSDRDYGLGENETDTPPLGSWFRVLDYPPRMPGRMHRTDTVDFVMCLEGEIDMELDDGATVGFAAGDVMIQQGTNHSWINNSDRPCRIAFALLDAKKRS